MVTELDSAALLVARAAWLRDVAKERTTAEAAMAKLSATELGSRVVDRAVQLHGARGVLINAFGPRTVRAVTHLDVSREQCMKAADVLVEIASGSTT